MALAGLLALLLAAWAGGSTSADPPAPLSPDAALGEKIFQDASLTASGAQSCAPCHKPDTEHGPGNALPAQIGGPAMDQQGLRQTPSSRCLAENFALNFDNEGTPNGGFFWGGRAASLADQAGQPLLKPLEMANADKAAVVQALAKATSAGEFRRIYRVTPFDDVEGAFRRMTLALQAYQLQDRVSALSAASTTPSCKATPR